MKGHFFIRAPHNKNDVSASTKRPEGSKRRRGSGRVIVVPDRSAAYASQIFESSRNARKCLNSLSYRCGGYAKCLRRRNGAGDIFLIVCTKKISLPLFRDVACFRSDDLR